MFSKLKIKEIIENKNPHQIDVPLSGYKNEKFNSYLLQVSDLLLNPYNDRFAMQRSESENLNIDQSEEVLFSESVQNEIAKILWNTNEKKNKDTEEDILNQGVLKPIVIDYSGVVIDGNRRVSISKKILSDSKLKAADIKKLSHIVCIVIPRKLNQDEIYEYETSLQISEDSKLEYDPINLYLKINHLLEKNNDYGDRKYKIVKNLMGSKYNEKDIREREDTFGIMKDYLKAIGKEGIFTYLKKREDSFKIFGNFRKKMQNKKIKSEHVDYDDTNIQKRIKNLSYWLIWNQYEGKAFRDLYSSEKIKRGPFASIKSIEYLEEINPENLNLITTGNQDKESVSKIVTTATKIANSCIKKEEMDVEKLVNDIKVKIWKLHNEFSNNKKITHNNFEKDIENIKNKINEILNAIHKNRY